MKYYKKLLSTNILISTLYILIFTIIICGFSYFTSKQLYINNLSDGMQNISEQAHSAVTNAKLIANALSNNEATQNYACEDVPDNSNRIALSQFLYADMGMLMTNNAKVAITKYTDNHTVTSIATSAFDYYYKSFGITTEQMEDTINYFSSQSIYNLTYLFSTNSKGTFMHIITKNITIAGKRQFYIMVSYPISAIFQIDQYKDSIIPAISIGNDIIYIEDEAYKKPLKAHLEHTAKSKYKIFSFSPTSLNFRSDITYHYIEVNSKYFNKHYTSIMEMSIYVQSKFTQNF